MGAFSKGFTESWRLAGPWRLVADSVKPTFTEPLPGARLCEGGFIEM